MSQLVIETKTGWMINCPACTWHEFPKEGKPGATWTFNGDLFKPTFTPSMNEIVNNPDSPHYNPNVKSRRCHFIITDGMMQFCGDCSHEYVNKTVPMIPYEEQEVKYHAFLLTNPD